MFLPVTSHNFFSSVRHFHGKITKPNQPISNIVKIFCTGGGDSAWKSPKNNRAADLSLLLGIIQSGQVERNRSVLPLQHRPYQCQFSPDEWGHHPSHTQAPEWGVSPTCRLSHISWLYVRRWISVGELRYNACPSLVKQKVRAILMSVTGK